MSSVFDWLIGARASTGHWEEQGVVIVGTFMLTQLWCSCGVTITLVTLLVSCVSCGFNRSTGHSENLSSSTLVLMVHHGAKVCTILHQNCKTCHHQTLAAVTPITSSENLSNHAKLHENNVIHMSCIYTHVVMLSYMLYCYTHITTSDDGNLLIPGLTAGKSSEIFLGPELFSMSRKLFHHHQHRT